MAALAPMVHMPMTGIHRWNENTIWGEHERAPPSELYGSGSVGMYVTVCATVKFCCLHATILHSTKMAATPEPCKFSLRSTSSKHYIERNEAAVPSCPSLLIYAAKSGRQATTECSPKHYTESTDPIQCLWSPSNITSGTELMPVKSVAYAPRSLAGPGQVMAK